MSALPSLEAYISAEEYLQMEELSPFRHELIDGVMYAMSGTSDDHDTIESNLRVALKLRLRGRVSKVTGGNIQLQVAESRDENSGFYYPDAMICCDPSDRGAKKGIGIRKRPSAIFEVLSPSTRNLDSGRKRTDYLSLPSLDVYVRIEQSRPEVVIERRTATGWEMETVKGLDAVVFPADAPGAASARRDLRGRRFFAIARAMESKGMERMLKAPAGARGEFKVPGKARPCVLASMALWAHVDLMSQSLVEEPYMSVQEYLELEGISPFKHEYAEGIMYAMHCGSMQDYFELETESPFRHEYMDGVMYAMAGGKKPHHVISRNLGGMLYNRLDGHRCTNSTSNMKLKLPSQDPEEAELCYPDDMISCDPTDEGETKGHAWIERPTVIFEITSASTRRIDEGGKREAYLTIPSLQAYVRIEQERPEVVVERRADNLWLVDRIVGLGGTVRLASVAVELPLAELYKNVKFRQ